jgi:hypothetical protein
MRPRHKRAQPTGHDVGEVNPAAARGALGVDHSPTMIVAPLPDSSLARHASQYDRCAGTLLIPGTPLRSFDERGQPFECLMHCLDPALSVLHVVADALGGFGAVEYLGDDRRVTVRLELEAPAVSL